MPDWLWTYITQQGPLVLLLSLNIYAILSDLVVTRGHHRDMLKEKDTQIAKGELRERERQRVADGLTDVLTEVAPIVRKAIREETRP